MCRFYSSRAEKSESSAPERALVTSCASCVWFESVLVIMASIFFSFSAVSDVTGVENSFKGATKKNWCEKKELLRLPTIVAHVNIHFKCEAPRGIREILRRNTFADILYFASVSSNRSIWLVSLQRCALGRIQTNHLQRAQLSFIRVREWVCVRLSAYTEARTQACC